jgi:hypothetical protein
MQRRHTFLCINGHPASAQSIAIRLLCPLVMVSEYRLFHQMIHWLLLTQAPHMFRLIRGLVPASAQSIAIRLLFPLVMAMGWHSHRISKMDSTYLSITSDDKLAAVANAVIVRENELLSYGVNIANYTSTLASLPEGDAASDADDFTRGQYEWRDRLRMLLQSERMERWKAETIYKALLAKLPADETQRAALIEEAKARMSKASS